MGCSKYKTKKKKEIKYNTTESRTWQKKSPSLDQRQQVCHHSRNFINIYKSVKNIKI